MRLEDTFPSLGILPTIIVVTVIAIALQLSGVWVTMLVAGAFAGLFTRRTRCAFISGFTGVALAWFILFVYLILTSQALAIAGFFIGLLGISGGWIVITISVVIGGLLGGFGGVLGRALFELVDELSNSMSVEDSSSEAEASVN